MQLALLLDEGHKRSRYRLCQGIAVHYLPAFPLRRLLPKDDIWQDYSIGADKADRETQWSTAQQGISQSEHPFPGLEKWTSLQALCLAVSIGRLPLTVATRDTPTLHLQADHSTSGNQHDKINLTVGLVAAP